MAGPFARRNTAYVAMACYFITLPFLALVLTGNIRINDVLNDFYFFKLDVSHIIPVAVTNSNLLNSVARSLGLHDFYTVGLWNFCEGYLDEGVTFCSKPQQFFWFNPVEVLVSELLAGARIALPSQVVTILNLLRIGQQVMYAFFMAGSILNVVLLVATPLVIITRWWTLVVGFVAGLSGIVLTVAAIIATVISVAAKVALTAQDQLNISAEIGIKMFVFMWIAAIFTDVAFLFHAGMACCCRPDRSQRNKGSDSFAMEDRSTGRSLPAFGSRRRRTSQ